MRTMHVLVVTIALVSTVAFSQQANPPQGGSPAGSGEYRGQRGPGTGGTITAMSGNTISIKTFDGQTAQISLSSNTQFRKNRQPATISDFKVGDMIFVRGEQKDGVWQAEIVGGRNGQSGLGMGNVREALGKRFILGEIKAINGTQLTIQRPDNVSQTITVDENTSFRKDNESVTLADFKVGDHVFGPGEIKNDVFVPAVLNIGEPQFMRRGGGGPPNQQAPNPQ